MRHAAQGVAWKNEKQGGVPGYSQKVRGSLEYSENRCPGKKSGPEQLAAFHPSIGGHLPLPAINFSGLSFSARTYRAVQPNTGPTREASRQQGFEVDSFTFFNL